ncbi:MAG: TfoX family protein [Deltaproteobacteria bacterium]|nr:MAG: TfoX family protein [Deltaproteobacteria bacterium]
MPKKNEFVEYLLDLLADFGPVEAKAMFGGYGIYKQNRMFAIVIDDTLYLKTDEKTNAGFEARGLKPFTYQRNHRKISLSYRQAPEEALEDSRAMRYWAEKAYAAALRASSKKRKKEG